MKLTTHQIMNRIVEKVLFKMVATKNKKLNSLRCSWVMYKADEIYISGKVSWSTAMKIAHREFKAKFELLVNDWMIDHTERQARLLCLDDAIYFTLTDIESMKHEKEIQKQPLDSSFGEVPGQWYEERMKSRNQWPALKLHVVTEDELKVDEENKKAEQELKDYKKWINSHYKAYWLRKAHYDALYKLVPDHKKHDAATIRAAINEVKNTYFAKPKNTKCVSPKRNWFC